MYIIKLRKIYSTSPIFSFDQVAWSVYNDDCMTQSSQPTTVNNFTSAKKKNSIYYTKMEKTTTTIGVQATGKNLKVGNARKDKWQLGYFFVIRFFKNNCCLLSKSGTLKVLTRQLMFFDFLFLNRKLRKAFSSEWYPRMPEHAFASVVCDRGFKETQVECCLATRHLSPMSHWIFHTSGKDNQWHLKNKRTEN